MLRNLIKSIKLLFFLEFMPSHLRLLTFSLGGILLGLTALTIHLSRAPSYLTDEPEACVNCHVMRSAYVTWRHSSHAEVAHCNDCHVPHDSFWKHWAFKAQDGLRHAAIFTLRWEPQVIRLSRGAQPVVEENCRRCHGPLIHASSLANSGLDQLRCWDCHREVPHGRVHGLATTPGYLDPALPPFGFEDRPPEIGGRSPRQQEPESKEEKPLRDDSRGRSR